VIHALHAHEHHHCARQQKEQQWEVSDGEPMLVQRDGNGRRDCATAENQTTPAGKPAA